MASNDDAFKGKSSKTRAYLGSGKINDPLSNPCLKEQNLSMKCLDENILDKDACEIYFANYKACRAFWNNIMRERRGAGLLPYLPLPEDRDEIKAKRFGRMQ